MYEEFLDKIQLVLDSMESVKYKRIERTILCVNDNDEALSRCIDFAVKSSIRMHIGRSTSYYDGEEANEEKVLAIFLKILYSEIVETHIRKGYKILEYRYKLKESNEAIGLSSTLSSLIKKGDHTMSITHRKILDEVQYDQLRTELEEAFNVR